MNTLPQGNGEYQEQESLHLRPLDIERGERLLYRLTEFGHLLWESGINVDPRQMIELSETLNLIDITNRDDFYYTLKCYLLTKHEQEPIFNQMFNYFWFIRHKPKKDDAQGVVRREEKQMRLPPSERKRLAEQLNSSEMRRELHKEMRQTERKRREGVDRDDNQGNDEDEGNPQGLAYSAFEQLRKK